MKAEFLGILLCLALLANALGESPPAVVSIGSAKVNLRPPYGFSECSRATPFLSRYFSMLIRPPQVQIGGYLTEKETALAQAGTEPMLWHVAFAYSMERFKDANLTAKEFAEIRQNFRDNIQQAVQSSADKTRQTIEQFGGKPKASVTSQGVFQDDAYSFAYLAKINDTNTKISAMGFVLVRGKIIWLNITKVYSSDVDTDWTKAAMKWWIEHIRTDNP
jgi:hypothetical protein